MIYFLCVLAALTTGGAIADEMFTSDVESHLICDEQKCDTTGPVKFSATFLYLRPSVDDTHFVLSSFDNTFNGSLYPNGKRHQNTASFAPGISLEGSYIFWPGDSFLNLQATYFSTSSTHSVSGDFLYDTNGFPGFGSQDSPLYEGTAFSKNYHRFYAGDLTYSNTLLNCLPDKCLLIMGLHGVSIGFKEHCMSRGTFTNDDMVRPLANDLHRNSKFLGIGPQIGVDYQLFLPRFSSLLNDCAIRLKATGALLCGRNRSDLTYVTLRTGPGGVAVRNGDLWRVISAAHADLGFIYTRDCQSSTMTIQLGYEFMFYSPCVNKITGLDVAFAGDTLDLFSSFSLQGPYFRITSTF